MNKLERMLQDLAETRRAEAAKPKPDLAPIVQLRPAPACDTQGHEYDFGICLDCEQPDPAFEPDDDTITTDYLNRTFAA